MVFTSKIFGIEPTTIEQNRYPMKLTLEVGHDKTDMFYETADPKEVYKLKIRASRGDTLGFYTEGKTILYIEYYL